MSDLPKKVIAEDHRLERAASTASEELARLRWHWTLDETNGDRVGFREYARAVEKRLSTIASYAHGFAAWEAGDRVNPINEMIARANMGSEREAATEAVAKARGVGFGTARQMRPTEVKRVLDVARDRVEKHGDTIEEASRKAADWIVRSERAARDRDAERKQRLGLRLVELEGCLDGARRKLEDALDVARDVEWEPEHQELLRATVSTVRALLELIDVALAGAADVDWDAELAALKGEDT